MFKATVRSMLTLAPSLGIIVASYMTVQAASVNAAGAAVESAALFSAVEVKAASETGKAGCDK